MNLQGAPGFCPHWSAVVMPDQLFATPISTSATRLAALHYRWVWCALYRVSQRGIFFARTRLKAPRVYVWTWIRRMISILNYFSRTNMAGDDCEPSPKWVRTVDNAGSQSPEQVCTSVDDPGIDHLSENAGQNTDAPPISALLWDYGKCLNEIMHIHHVSSLP